MKTIKAADLFCGAGGTSTGLVEACSELGITTELTAINHWEVAVQTHTVNHPDARHLCASLDSLNPRALFKEGELDLLWASPECTHHSVARGGKPVSDQSRATAWCVVRWAEALRPRTILIENVKEFEGWGPLIRKRVQKPKPSFRKWFSKHPQGTRAQWEELEMPWGLEWVPDPARKGEIFHAWVNTLRSIGYKVEWRVLCAADYGDPTTRERLFVQCALGNRKIVWPEPTHAPQEEVDMFGTKRKRWVPARDIIDWSLEGKSIFGRKKPLSENTMRRILVGLEKFGLKPFTVGAGGPVYNGKPSDVDRPLKTVLTENHTALAEPFLVHLRGTGTANSVNNPSPTVTAGGNHLGLAQPYLVQACHSGGERTRPVDEPLPTVAGNGEWGVVQPFLIGSGGPARAGEPRPVDKPINTVLTRPTTALIQPMLIGQQSGATARPVDQPAPTVATGGAIALVEPYLINIDHKSGNGTPRPASQPLSTVSSKARHAVIEPYLVMYNGKSLAQGVNEPLSTVTTKERHGVVEPYLVKFYGTGVATSVNQPLDTVTTKERFGLVRPTVIVNGKQYLLDIRFRMLKAHELAGAQGFPKTYKFKGTDREVVKQIGNAVPRHLAKALVRAAVSQKP